MSREIIDLVVSYEDILRSLKKDQIPNEDKDAIYTTMLQRFSKDRFVNYDCSVFLLQYLANKLDQDVDLIRELTDKCNDTDLEVNFNVWHKISYAIRLARKKKVDIAVKKKKIKNALSYNKELAKSIIKELL